MNDDILNDLTAHVIQTIGALPASRARRRQMQEELLAHLVGIYDEEVERLQDERAVADRAKQRFGRPDDLSGELQGAVPLLERLVFLFCGKGHIMWRWLWIVGCVAILVGLSFVLPGIAHYRNGVPDLHLGVNEAFWIYFGLPLFGGIITLAGLGMVVSSVVRAFRTRSC
jgi:hypothetical protein